MKCKAPSTLGALSLNSCLGKRLQEELSVVLQHPGKRGVPRGPSPWTLAPAGVPLAGSVALGCQQGRRRS